MRCENPGVERCKNSRPWLCPQASTGDPHSPLWKKVLTSMDRVGYPVNEPVEIGIFLAHPIDLLDGVQHGGMVFAAEEAADLGQRGLGQLLDEIHRHLARIGNGPGIGRSEE